MKKLWHRIQNDVMGGITAAIVALPLALAFGIASGAGAMAGLYASIFGGLIAAIFGGCGVQISGPTGAMIGVLVGVVSRYGVGGMFLAGAIAGLMQVVLGLLRLGGFVKYLPQPVIAGFTNGVAILFFMTGFNDAIEVLPITIITILVIVLAMKYLKKLPESLLGLIVGLIVNELFIHSPHVVGNISLEIPKLAIGIMPFHEIANLILPAFTICLLGSISALLSAEVTDGMIGARHNSNRELVGQGLGNLVSSLIGGIPISGAVARSGVNVLSGGRTRLSSILHSIFLALMVLTLGPVVKRIPLASLAAILMVSSLRTADWKSLKRIPNARWSYGLIMIVTTVLTVVKDLTVAVGVGMALAGILVLFEMAFSPKGKRIGPGPDNAFHYSAHSNVEVIAFHGPLFFIGVENMRRRIRELSDKPVLVLDFTDVFVIDESGALALKDFILKLEKEGQHIYIGGLRSEPLRMLIRMKVVESLGRNKVYKKLKNAIEKASEKQALVDSDNLVIPSLDNTLESTI